MQIVLGVHACGTHCIYVEPGTQKVGHALSAQLSSIPTERSLRTFMDEYIPGGSIIEKGKWWVPSVAFPSKQASCTLYERNSSLATSVLCSGKFTSGSWKETEVVAVPTSSSVSSFADDPSDLEWAVIGIGVGGTGTCYGRAAGGSMYVSD